ncbi:MAG TPA: SIMPL domain-containing protein [Candidatus Paceibacterota bacterium]
MNNKLKVDLSWPLIAILAGATFAFITLATSYSKSIEPSSFRNFSVSAEGEAIGIPDVAKFNFTVITEGGKDIGALQTDNSTKINKAISALKTSGVKDEDIKTASYNLNPRYQYFNCSNGFNQSTKPCPPPEIVGYTITQSVSVKIRDFSKIGLILSEIVKVGVNDVSNLQFEIDDPIALQNEARANAIEKAKEKALSIAKSAGFSIGRLISIQEGFNYDVYARSYGQLLDTAEGTPIPPQIEPGSQEIKISVTLKYEIR